MSQGLNSPSIGKAVVKIKFLSRYFSSVQQTNIMEVFRLIRVENGYLPFTVPIVCLFYWFRFVSARARIIHLAEVHQNINGGVKVN